MIKLSNKSLSKAISNSLEIPLEISNLLVDRGLTEELDIYHFFLKNYKNLNNPFYLPDMKKSIERIKKAVVREEKIIIFGDYDVDGMMASTIIYRFLRKVDADVDVFIPKRTDGYGLSKESIDVIKMKYDADLIISVDNGISAFETVDYCNLKNIDIIITDHHEIQDNKIPNAYSVINPKRLKTDSFGLKNLCGAGIAFFLFRGLNHIFYGKDNGENVLDYLVLAMLGTIADVVPLTGDNRLIVNQGINYIYETSIMGLNKILDEIRFMDYPSSKDIAFRLIPVLNSVARMGDPMDIISLLTEDSLVTYKMAKNIIKTNNERKKITREWLDKINNHIILENDQLVVYYSEEIPLGISGIISGQMVDNKNKSIVTLSGDDELKASCRAKEGHNLLQILELKELLIDGGGHKEAMGFSLKKKNLEEFINQLKEIKIGDETAKNEKKPDIEVDSIDIFLNKNFLRLLYHMEPFGKSNEAPIIKINNVKRIPVFNYLSNGLHVKVQLSDNSFFLDFFLDGKRKYQWEQVVNHNEECSIIAELHSDGVFFKGFIKEIIIK